MEGHPGTTGDGAGLFNDQQGPCMEEEVLEQWLAQGGKEILGDLSESDADAPAM